MIVVELVLVFAPYLVLLATGYAIQAMRCGASDN